MKYNLCKSCKYYEDDIKTPFLRHPKHCTHPQLADYFSLDVGGFIHGIDIFHCDCFLQSSPECGDYFIELENGYVSWVIPRERQERGIYCLTDNSQNIKEVKPKKKIYGKIKPKPRCSHLEEMDSSGDSDSFGTSWCPY